MSSRWWLAWGAVLAAAGCGAEEPADPPSATRGAAAADPVRAHVPLVPTPVSPAPRAEPQLAASFDAAADSRDWVVDAAAVRRIRHQDGGRALRVRCGDGAARLVIPGPFDPGSFDRVTVAAWFLELASSVQVRCFRDNVVVAESGPVWAEDLFQLLRVDVDLPQLALETEPIELVELVLTSGRPVDLSAVELWDVPLADFLLPGSGEGLLHVAGEARRGVVLRAGEARAVRVPELAGARLAFSTCVPAALWHARELELRASWVGAGGETRESSIPLDREAEADCWVEQELPLEGGGERTVHLELRAAGGEEAVCALAETRAVRPAAAPPTVLLVTSDTHRADGLGRVAGGLGVATPNLDALADRGTLFADCWSTTNITLPSHATILTGVHPRDTGHVTNTGSLVDAARTLAEAFREAGFRTFAAVSVFHLGEESGLDQGFDRMLFPPNGVWDAEQTAGVLRSWLPTAEGVPLFVWLHFFDAHTPYEPPGDWDRRYYGKGGDPFDPSLPDPALCERCLPPEYRGLRDLEFGRAQYRAEIDYLDHVLGDLLAEPRLADAVVAFTADHGEVLQGEDSLFNHGILVPDTLRVPLILAGPGVPAGERRDEVVTHLDLGRTLLDLGGAADVPFPGRALVADEPPRGGPVFALSADGKAAAVASGGWFLVLYLREHAGPFEGRAERHAVELYRLDGDAEHRVDRAAEEPARARRMRAALVAWLGEASDENLASHAAPPLANAARLAALGYATDPSWNPEESWFDPECECERCAAWR